MLDLTAAARANGARFDGVDLFLFDPHVSIDSTDDDLKRLADKIGAKGLVVGSLVAPVWPPTGGGSAMGSNGERGAFLTQVRKACAIGKKLKDLGIRRYGIVRIDSAASPADWAEDPAGNTKKIADTFRQAADIAEDFGERLAAEGEICWGGMHSVKRNVELLERWTGPRRVGFQADMAHTLLFTMGYNAPDDRILPGELRLVGHAALDEGLKKMTRRAAAVDDRFPRRAERRDGEGIRLARQDRPALPAARSRTASSTSSAHAGFWLRDDSGKLDARSSQHICWDGCMFPNAVMTQQKTWNDVLAAVQWTRTVGDDAARVWAPECSTNRRESQHRPGRLRLHGPDALERVPAGATIFFDLPCEAGAQGGRARNADRVKAFADELGLRVVSRPTGAIWWRARTSIVIDIASPNDTHHEIAIAAAKAGKMVMCEKPLGRNATEARGDGRPRSRRPACRTRVWYNYRRVPAVTMIKQLIDERKFGRIFHYRAKFLQDWTISQDLPQGGEGLWRLDVVGRGQRRHRRPARAQHRHRAVAERSDRRSDAR